MKDVVLQKLRSDVQSLQSMIEQYKSRSWAAGIYQDGKRLDTTEDDLKRLEALLTSLRHAISELE